MLPQMQGRVWQLLLELPGSAWIPFRIVRENVE